MTGARSTRGGAVALGKITKPVVERLAPGTMLWDTALRGFGVRRQTRDAFYLVRYRIFGRQRFVTLGRHGALTPDQARRQAKELLGSVAGGVDPATERAKAKTEAKARLAETFGAEIDRYLDRKRPTMKPRAFEEIARHLRNHAQPLARLPLADIDRRTIALRLAEIETASGCVARNRVRSTLSAFFNFAIREGQIEINPVSGTGKAPEGGSRERVLSDAELAEIWRALGPDQFGDIVRLLILTAQRREEIGGLRWSEVDLARDLIVLPPERTKNKRLHELPLSPAVRAILERQPRRKNGDSSQRDFIFGLGQGGFSGWSDCKAALDQRLLAAHKAKAKAMPDWRLHDLRRTAATIMADKL